MEFNFFNIFTFLLTISALIGVWFNIKKNVVGFYIWSITNLMWAGVNFYKDIFWQGVLFLVYFFFAIYGIYEWKKKK